MGKFLTRHKTVPFDIGIHSLLEEDISLIDEHNGAPFVRKLKPLSQFFFHLNLFSANISACQAEKGTSRELGDAFYESFSSDHK